MQSSAFYAVLLMSFPATLPFSYDTLLEFSRSEILHAKDVYCLHACYLSFTNVFQAGLFRKAVSYLLKYGGAKKQCKPVLLQYLPGGMMS